MTDAEQVETERANFGGNHSTPWPMSCYFLHNQMENSYEEPALTGTSDRTRSGIYFPVRILLPSYSFISRVSFLLPTLLVSYWIFLFLVRYLVKICEIVVFLFFLQWNSLAGFLEFCFLFHFLCSS